MGTIRHDFIERAAQFGPVKSLIGIVTHPTDQQSAGDKPAVVILNTGTVHRVGHYRMYVSMSRKLARAGHTVLRFDFSGLGDSAPHSSGQPLLQSNLADIGAALEWLGATFGVSRVILIGLCSGADHAVLYGHSDPRVVGLVLIDPYLPTTARYFMYYIWRRLSDSQSWRKFEFRRSKLISLLFGRLRRKDSEPQHLSFPGISTRDFFEKIYLATAHSRIRLLVVGTGGPYAPRQIYREQFTEAFNSVPFDDLLRLEFFKETDHTFSSVSDRSALNDLVVDWCSTEKFDRAVLESFSYNSKTAIT